MDAFNQVILSLQNLFALIGVRTGITYFIFIFALSFSIHLALLVYNQSLSPQISSRFKRYIFINAEKSEGGALQIGGLVFSLVLMIAIYSIFFFFPELLSNKQAKIIEVASHTWVGILIYGYLDDVQELRPIVKLGLQLLAVFIFCLRVSNIIYPEHSALAFVILTILSSIIINGSNLLDGLDTLTYKVSSSIFFMFMVLAAVHHNMLVIFLSLVCFMNMSGFYFYNREPSRVHMGETGVGSLGFSYVVLGTLLFENSRQFESIPTALGQCILPSVLPIMELGISFLRRILNSKSPFKGDKLHNHHILHLMRGFRASNASSIIALSYLCFFVCTVFITGHRFPILSIFVLTGMTLSWYLFVGYKVWFGDKFTFNLVHIQGILVKKKVRIIPSNILSDFKIVINSDHKKEDDYRDGE